METIYAFPGSFCPPTYGHLNIVQRAARNLPSLRIICSINPNKDKLWFSPEQCLRLWQSYSLPNNVSVEKIGDQGDIDFSRVVLVRGLRNDAELTYEKQVMIMNRQNFGIDNFLYIFGEQCLSHLSSSRARESAQKLDLLALAECVSPLVVSALLEKVLQVPNIFMVVGRTGSGKSTWSRSLQDLGHIHYIDADKFNRQLAPMICEHFKVDDPFKSFLENPRAVLELIKKPWLNLLTQALLASPKGMSIVIEVPYGLNDDYQLFRYLGGKIIHIGCHDIAQNLKRIEERGTPRHKILIESIKDKSESELVAQEHHLSFYHIDSSGSKKQLIALARDFDDLLLNNADFTTLVY